MKYRSAWVTITAKVFIPEYEIADELKLEDTDDESAEEQLYSVEDGKIVEAFDKIASERINEVFSTDDPMKLHDFRIDWSSLK